MKFTVAQFPKSKSLVASLLLFFFALRPMTRKLASEMMIYLRKFCSIRIVLSFEWRGDFESSMQSARTQTNNTGNLLKRGEISRKAADPQLRFSSHNKHSVFQQKLRNGNILNNLELLFGNSKTIVYTLLELSESRIFHLPK